MNSDRQAFETWLIRDYSDSKLNEIVVQCMWDAWQTRGNPEKYDQLVKGIAVHTDLKNVQYRFHVTYYYLATGMEGNADTKDYGYVMAANQLEAKNIIAERECRNPADRAFFKGCLSARRAFG